MGHSSACYICWSGGCVPWDTIVDKGGVEEAVADDIGSVDIVGMWLGVAEVVYNTSKCYKWVQVEGGAVGERDANTKRDGDAK